MRPALLLGLLLAACSSVSTTEADAPAGGGADANPAAEQCEMYCECMVSICDWQDVLGCPADCTALADDTRECRVIHCGLAQTAEEMGDPASRDTHCEHARGVGLCE